ncbi:TetR/AcrR family transcriptional regulator [Sphaerisporangium album]|uniref:TetR/AcrR family transcriptional regulator n=1 Tax=Sphaerisporangium album TaxID=509200 RepID=A0A367FC87_9ACTN|nr:TetR/AcrR family transcriptional regulator [Sphaerisporangium album]RCG27305.1 TetR/AcrR family transcriptional regulator [Sphaerisporangium album]
MLGRPRQDLHRADRILDSAAELLLRLGYRKVTIEDIARHAGIGKGTVYLHWRTKQQLFEALLLREALTYVEGLVDELRRDPSTVLPHRLLAASFLIVHDRPVLRALFGGDAEQLQARPADSPTRGHELLATARFFAVLTRHGLFRDDVPNLAYALTATHAGFLLMDNLGETGPTATAPDVRARAGSLAHVVRTAFEPAGPPDPQAVASAAAEVLEAIADVIPPYRERIYGYRRAQEAAETSGAHSAPATAREPVPGDTGRRRPT